MAKQVKITWTQSTGNTVAPTSHIVQRSATENGTYTTIYTALGVTAEHTDVNVLDGETWWYRVGAVFASGTIKYLASEDITISETSSIVLFSDNFLGTTIDETINWNKDIADAATMNLVQNGNLTIDSVSSKAGDSLDTNLTSKIGYTLGAELVIGFDIQTPDQNALPFFSVGISNNSNLADATDRICLQRSLTTGKVGRQIYVDSTPNIQEETLDIQTAFVTIKIKITPTTVDYYYWNGAWTILGTQIANSLSGDYYPFIGGHQNNSFQNVDRVIDNYSLANADYTDQYPI